MVVLAGRRDPAALVQPETRRQSRPDGYFACNARAHRRCRPRARLGRGLLTELLLLELQEGWRDAAHGTLGGNEQLPELAHKLGSLSLKEPGEIQLNLPRIGLGL